MLFFFISKLQDIYVNTLIKNEIKIYNMTNNQLINHIDELNIEKSNVQNDSPEPWGLFFQDSATPQMEGLEELHDNIMFYLVIILFAVGWMMISIIRNYIR